MTSQTAPARDVGPGDTRPGSVLRTLLLWTFRILATVQAIVFLLQPISIGSFLQGSYEALSMHSIVGGILVPITMLVGAVGALLAIAARKWWLLLGSIVLVVATTMQVGIGYSRLLSIHVPLGVLLVGLGLWMAVWSWTKGASGTSRLARSADSHLSDRYHTGGSR